jgi:hypothetical protein
MHTEAYQYVAATVKRLPARVSVVEFGGRDFNGSVRSLFNCAKSYVAIDLYNGPGVDWVGNALDYAPAQEVDTVVCCETFEHTPQWPELLRHAYDMLGRDGVLIVTCAAPPRAPHSHIDGGNLVDGEYYANVEPDEFCTAMGRFDWAEYQTSVADRGDLYCYAKK